MDASDLTAVTADVPIRNSADDKLDRGPFARLLSDALLRPASVGASVFGLTGPYGTGKSSVAAMVEECIGDRAHIVKFEPWMVGTREALAEEFILTLGRSILPNEPSQEAEGTRKKFWRYGSKVLMAASIGAKAIGPVVPGATIASSAAESASKAMQLAAEGLEARAADPTLSEMRRDLVDELASVEHPVIAIVDDIDRLTREELRTTLQLIKACADFPGVRYLLLYDREQVLHALDGFVNSPEAFLEKIVNQTFDLPEATTKQRSELLENALESLELHEGLPKPAMERLAVVFDEVLLPGLQTVRQVKRFISTVRSLLPAVKQDGLLDIDPADFLALEFLRQYVPNVYAALRDEEAPPAGGRISRLVNHKEWEKAKADKRKSAIASTPEQYRAVAEEAIQSLYKDAGASAVTAHRFGTDFWKPAYFGFHGGRAHVSEREWRDFLQHLAKSDEPQRWLQDWSDREKRDKWVSAITSRVQEIPWPQSKSLLKVLFEWGDQQNPETSAFFARHHSWEDAIRFCSDAIMSATPDNLDPVVEMAEVVRGAGSLVTSGYCIGIEAARARENTYDRWSRDYDLKQLTDPLRRKLTSLLESNRIWDLPDPGTARSAAHYFMGKKRYDEWWNSVTQDEPALVKYIERDLGRLESWHVGFDEGPMIQAIRDLDPAKLSPKGQEVRLQAIASVIGARAPWKRRHGPQ